MIVLDNRLAQNRVVATLREMQCYTTSTYLLVLKNLTTLEEFSTVVNDISLSPLRYQEFTINMVSGTTDPLLSELNLPLEGQYDYWFYENPVSGTTSTGLHLVELGRAKVIGCSDAPVYYNADSNLNVVYESDKYKNC